MARLAKKMLTSYLLRSLAIAIAVWAYGAGPSAAATPHGMSASSAMTPQHSDSNGGNANGNKTHLHNGNGTANKSNSFGPTTPINAGIQQVISTPIGGVTIIQNQNCGRGRHHRDGWWPSGSCYLHQRAW